MAVYTYQRIFSNGAWNINNPNDVDEDGNPVILAQRIYDDATIGNKLSSVYLNANATVEMTETLTAEEKTILDNIVDAHENASGTINETTYIPMRSAFGTYYVIYVDDAGALQVDPE